MFCDELRHEKIKDNISNGLLRPPVHKTDLEMCHAMTLIKMTLKWYMIKLEPVLLTFYVMLLLYSLVGSLSQWLDTLGRWTCRFCSQIFMAVQWVRAADSWLSLLVAQLCWSIHKTMRYAAWSIMRHKLQWHGRYVFFTLDAISMKTLTNMASAIIL